MYRLLRVMVVVLLACSLLHSQGKPEKIDELLTRYYDFDQFNGAALVAENGKVIFFRGFGLANMEWNIPNAPDTKFRIGSITKQFTGMLILQLMEEGKLRLDGTIRDYLPDYPSVHGDIVTIHHLLTHTSGIPSYTSFPGFFQNDSRDPSAPEEFIKIFADSSLEYEPGSKWSYNNSAYFLLGVIIEKLTGKTYEQALHARILDPLGLKATGYDLSSPVLSKRAAGYEKRGGDIVHADYLDMTIPYAGGSMYSTVEDLFAWDQALYEGKLLKQESYDLYFHPHAKVPGGNAYYAYGWGVGFEKVGNSDDSVYTIRHGGGINGFNTLIVRIPSSKNLIVLMNNTGGAPLGNMSRAISGILYDMPYQHARRSIAEELRKQIGTGKADEDVRQVFASMRDDESTYRLSEREMNNLGYEYMRNGETRQAILVFALNVESYPKSSNAYDSLGEAYLEAKNTELAIENYKRSVELDPDNENGKNMLRELQQ